jgi:uncharacterized protein (TIGR02246 family)
LTANKCIPITKEADLDSFSNPDIDSDVSKIAAVLEALNAALKINDANRLAALVTDDVVSVRGNGRCVCGREEIKADFLKRVGRFDFDRKFSSAEIIVRDKWAMEICEMETALTGVGGGIQVQTHSRVVILFARQPDTSWKVARVLELLD